MQTEDRLEQELRFVVEIDRLKGVLRQSYLADGSRRENSAEHSWHVAMMAMVLAEHANEAVDRFRVIRMLMLHDLVEIDAGDTFAYDDAALAGKAAKERAAADRIFGLLPPDLGSELRALWDEFEIAETAEARFANALDRLMPMLHNVLTEGRAWRAHGVTADKVLSRNAVIGEGSEALWAYARRMIREAVGRGFLPAGPGSS